MAAAQAEERARHTLAALLDDDVALQTGKGRITTDELRLCWRLIEKAP